MNRDGDSGREGEALAALLRRSRDGDQRALEQLLDGHDDEVLNMAYRLVGHRDDALDIRQQTYLSVCRSIDRFDGRSAFRTWLLRIVVNQCRDHLRRKSANRRRTDGWRNVHLARDGSSTGVAGSLRDEQAQRVATAVAALPEPQREVLVLRHYHDMSLTAVAALLEIPLSTASSRLSGAMHRMREALRDVREEGVSHAM